MESKNHLFDDNNNSDQNKGETIRELAHRHLMDKNHVTTDEELTNAKLELNGEVDLETPEHDLNDADEATLTDADSVDQTSNKESDDSDNKGTSSDVPNPYDILNP